MGSSESLSWGSSRAGKSRTVKLIPPASESALSKEDSQGELTYASGATESDD